MNGIPASAHSVVFSKRWAAAVVAIALALFPSCALAAEHDVRPGPGVTDVRSLSDYHSALQGTPGDTHVYVLEGSQSGGGTVLILGGTHAGEIAGVMAAVLLVEMAEVTAGRMFVITHANNSAAWSTEDLGSESPRMLTFVSSVGEERSFAYGTRRTAPEHQEPDGEVFVHYPSGFELPGYEGRNLNRVHPGREDGTLTEQISYALFELVRSENVDLVVDMHEAGVGSVLANMLISHPRALQVASLAVLHLELRGIRLGIERSRDDFRGYSHREFGDHTNALALLIESPNPAQGGADGVGDPVADPFYPLAHRVRLQLLTIAEIVNAKAMLAPGWSVSFGFPFSLDELLTREIGEFLR